MNKFGRMVMRIGLFSVLSVLPLAAQVDDGVSFTTAFPFYAGSTKLPAGSYTITQPDVARDVLRIESSDGKTSALVLFVPTETLQPHGNSAVTFHRYGDADYLDRAWLAGETDGIVFDPKRLKVTVDANANIVDLSAVSSGQ